ncbi:MAG: Tm-1-like ATP-binding domain-containing protein [Actinomycetota bacterium]
MNRTIVILGSMDTKGEEYAFIKRHIGKEGFKTLIVDVGVIGPPVLKPDIGRHEVAKAAGSDLDKLISEGPTRDRISPVMAEGSKKIVAKLLAEGKISGIISCGGTQGTTLSTAVMQSLPVGFPKVMVSTIASGNTSRFVGIKDITMMNSVADIMGLNRVTRKILGKAAGAVCGMVKMEIEKSEDEKELIALTTVGITTPGAMKAKEVLEKAGFETIVFHAVGTGGRAMEALIKEGQIHGVLDLATIEVIQEMLGGYLAATPERMTVATGMKIPQIICPGAVSCNTYGPPETIPEKFKGRKLVRHSAMFTNVRTNAEELRALAREQAKRVNPAKGHIEWFIPMKGFCSYSVEGGPLYDPEADKAYVEALKSELRDDIYVRVIDRDINDPVFATMAAERLVELMRKEQ